MGQSKLNEKKNSFLKNEDDPEHIKDLIDRLCAIASDDNKDILLYLPVYNRALIGHTFIGNACYSYNAIISILVERENWNEEEAIDYVDYNMIGYHYGKDQIGPIIVFA